MEKSRQQAVGSQMPRKLSFKALLNKRLDQIKKKSQELKESMKRQKFRSCFNATTCTIEYLQLASTSHRYTSTRLPKREKCWKNSTPKRLQITRTSPAMQQTSPTKPLNSKRRMIGRIVARAIPRPSLSNSLKYSLYQ